ncbi:hypothetical protein M407DRAFT_29873 [Tulasnella calospora MUT 4182]|uniref:Uncharacterized protein n=1 Tax=Tulasnella calospora MUT 4182 TaxID=1051891 RepID=A0A0C3Q8B6_9AGAM|nr:hypothetical protein M407DRAFT_29873 [Tulasnella calospora MUT 4182]
MSFVALVASATAVAVPDSANNSPLSKRQDPCALYCDPLSTANSQCAGDNTCICGGAVVSLMYTCATCKYQHDTTLYAALQQEVDQYVANCASVGVPVGALPIPYCSAPATRA